MLGSVDEYIMMYGSVVVKKGGGLLLSTPKPPPRFDSRSNLEPKGGREQGLNSILLSRWTWIERFDIDLKKSECTHLQVSWFQGRAYLQVHGSDRANMMSLL